MMTFGTAPETMRAPPKDPPPGGAKRLECECDFVPMNFPIA